MIIPGVLALAAAAYFGHWGYGVVVGIVAYFLSCKIHPEADCWHCKGKAKRRSQGGEGTVFHRCYVCGGSGARRRVGTMMLATVGLARGGRSDDDD